MKRLLIAAAAIAIAAGSQALAQSATITVSPEQRTTIKQYVVKERIKPVTLRQKVTVGGVLPSDVELAAVPETWGPSFRSYRYIYSDDRVMLVKKYLRSFDLGCIKHSNLTENSYCTLWNLGKGLVDEILIPPAIKLPLPS